MLWSTIALLIVLFRDSEAAQCELFPPVNAEGPQFGLIFIPGAQLKGELYGPLSAKIQEIFPGNLWYGLTEGWLADFPNPLEIAGAINDCIADAESAGYNTSLTFMAAHSLGGIFLEQYIADHADLSAGILLYGSYLPDLFGDTDNAFPVPALTAVGELDGLMLSYLLREREESAAAEESSPELQGRYPVVAIPDCNHGLVASGPMPEFVTSQDIVSDLDEEEAHRRYAEAGVAFMVTSYPNAFDSTVVEEQAVVLRGLREHTDEFMEPFKLMKMQEDDGKNKSPWLIEGQKILLTPEPTEDLSGLEILTEIVTQGDLGAVKPGINGTDCAAQVTTFSHPNYEFDPVDAGSLLSAYVIKSKFKLEDLVLEGMCLPARARSQCREINRAAYELALSAASEEARNRLLTSGRQLIFADDSVSPWGPGWEYSGGLTYTNVNATHVEIRATSLISEPDFFIPSAAGMHYCDLLSPYRALEWIYITGVQGL